ncbi:hypothetical protein PMI15_04668 [Polaromonas sp. CF318]|uniref:hypothetical protein n=1 Tax=Polaromonas sp. CF318 TaxID=1144318 RepID=UPI0002714511|nr:hypothetical protein [Polaromonas sp. CF318]EJL77346.1 hypothetical protein PMI15_04668 [Polaromonas sp. CF318]
MAKSDPNLLTQAEYARSRKARGLSGGSRESVRKAVDEKRISVFGPDKLISAELADSQWERNTRSRMSPQAQAGATPDMLAGASPVQTDAPAAPAPVAPATALPDGYTAARARREMADAETSEIQLKKLRGEILITADVARAGFEVGRDLRDAMESSVNSLAAELASVNNADACADILRRHNRALQELLSKSFREKIGAAAVTAI